jgi:hypothetical protein
MAETRQFTFQRTIAVEFSGKFPPDARALSGLGFVSVAVSKTAITIRKSQQGYHSSPIAHLEIVLKKNSALLRVSAPAAADPRLQELRAVATFMRVLSLFPSMQANAAELARLALPSIDTASFVADAPYESLSKKYNEAHTDLVSLLAKNRALLRSSEEGVLASLELERQAAALSTRISKLEAVSDDALLELIQDWLSSHRGRFNAALFAKTHNLPPARAEEGLSQLLASGEVKKIGGSLQVHLPRVHGEFEQKKQSPLGGLASLLGVGNRKKHNHI